MDVNAAITNAKTNNQNAVKSSENQINRQSDAIIEKIETPRPSPKVRLKESDITEAMMRKAFEDANRALAGSGFKLSYGVHEASGRIMVAVYDTETEEVIREVPPESKLDIYAKITEFTGMLFDKES